MTAARRSVLLVLVLLSSCWGIVGVTPQTTAAAAGDDDVVWLCRPGLADNPCEIPLDRTILRPDGTKTVVNPARPPSAKRPIDCFYVYPTVSNQLALTATKARSAEITSIARFQAAGFSSQCRMYAPVYRQITLAGIPAALILRNADQAYGDVLAAWRQYLANNNKGRGVVLIGHSQGTLLLRKLIREEVDPNAAVRQRLVGAVLMGGNVLTAKGSDRGGDFRNIPTCTRRGQAGCVVAYSTYSTDPIIPFFGSSSFDVLSPIIGLPTGAKYQVACTDPGRLSGNVGDTGVTVPTKKFAYGLIWAGIELSTLFRVPTAATTWVTSKDRYRGACATVRGARIYRYDPVGASQRPLEFPPTWGTHLFDMNLGLERLVSIVHQQRTTWLARR